MNVFGIVLDGTDLWLLAAAGACLAWLIPHWLSISRERHTSFRLACSKFRSAVFSSLSGLYPIPTEWPRDRMAIREVLREKFPALQAAIAEFRPQLPLLKRWRFDKAWQLYRLGKDGRECDQQDYWQYIPNSGDGVEKGRYYKHDNTSTYKETFKKNVDRLLLYARKT